MARAAGELRGRLGILSLYQSAIAQQAFVSGGAGVAPVSLYLAGLQGLATEALAERDDRKAFIRLLTEYNAGASVFAQQFESTSPQIVELKKSVRDPMQLTVTPAAVFQYVPDVVFTVGVGYASNSGISGSTIPISITTNLVGDLAGSALEAIGSDGIAKYLKDNIVIGTDLHATKDGKPSASLSAGLGEVLIKGLAFWPVLALEQADTADTRVPRGLLTKRATVSTWTAPILAVGIPVFKLDEFIKRVQKGQPVPVVTLGARFPFYYPGGTFDALAGLFGSNISKFDRDGGIQFVASFDIPLLKIKKPN
jgi:hypothetical protein